MSSADHDRIDLRAIVDASPEDAWALVSEPGWYINEGALVDHEISWNGSEVTVVDPDHGRFVLRREAVDSPHYVRDSSTVNEHGDVRLVELWVSTGPPVELRVVETGFAAMHGSTEEQHAQYEENTRTWRRQLELAAQRLAGQSTAVPSSSMSRLGMASRVTPSMVVGGLTWAAVSRPARTP